MPPSPLTHTTRSPGLPICAPMAAGSPKPMVPSPPEEIMLRGWLHRMYWAAHIWCWPTPVLKTALPCVILLMASMIDCGLAKGPSLR